MTTDKNSSLYSFSSHLSSKEMLDYYRHLLPEEERKRIELHLNSCNLCSDAIKGMSELPDALRIYHITHELKKRIGKRQSIRKNIFSRMELVSLITLLFILGIILLVVYYFLIFRKP
jgi:hypothetical protein